MSETRTCASGCTMVAAHTTDCAGGNCRGCLPRPVEQGTLCAWCWQRLQAAVAEIPALVQHLRAIGKPYAQSQPHGDGRAQGAPAESTVLPRPWLEADELESQLAAWGRSVLDDNPAAHRGPNAAPWHGDVAAWITPHLPWVAQQPWAEVMVAELSKDIARIKATWPTPDMAEREHHVPIPCPRCGLLTLHYTPPAWARQPFRVWCDNADCARVFSENEWDRFKTLALDPRRQAG